MKKDLSPALSPENWASLNWRVFGTVFLDEISEMSINLQAKLLRCFAGKWNLRELAAKTGLS